MATTVSDPNSALMGCAGETVKIKGKTPIPGILNSFSCSKHSCFGINGQQNST